MAGGHSHRSTVKNGHKPFKSKHASKGALKNKFKGKVEKDVKTSKPVKGASKLQRKNLAKQLKEHKIAQTAQSRKLFDGIHGAEKVVTVIPLTEDVAAEDIVNRLIDGAKIEGQDASMIQGTSVTSVRINKFKANLKFIIPDFNNFVSILDAAKVADFVVFGLSGTSEVDPDYGEQIIRALELQGIAHVMGVVTNLSVTQPKEKFQLDLKQSLQSYFKHFFPADEKIYNLENASDSLIAIRTLCQKFPKSITWRDSRGWIIADNVNWESANTENPQDGYLTVEGTARGTGFNANRLIHIPGQGDFQLERIERLQRGGDLDTYEATADQETLDELAPNEVSMDDWEQEAYEYDDEAVRYENGYLPAEKVKMPKLNLPEGTSDYQAKWFLEDDIVSDDDIESEESEPELVEDDEEMDVEEIQTEPEDAQSEMFVELSPEEEERQLREHREKEEEDREFPDELELNPTESGKERLKRYRGLKNLHNSTWDCDEYDPKAPSEWKRLLRISNFKATKNKILKDSIKEAQVTAGSKVKLYIRAPQFITSNMSHFKEVPFILYGLLEHEHKLAVVNFSIQPWEDYEKPIPSKDTIIVQYGPRRQVIQPLYSAASNSPNNVHKYERFLHQDSVGIATAIAPVNFTNAPAIFFKQISESPKKIELVGKGSFLNAEHQRVLAKRAILTGHPLKIHKNVVTIRYMFFNAEDINFFKAVPLFTKSGRSGFIKDSLGTHGYFKANFDGKLTSQDTVAMSLFKRVWPKQSIMWTQ
ncbi:Pre-rRNA-processing protein [Wickerhamomyces ciferrii]|uniref:Pre-rRNA-processing protein n=1 Tax=Wickerhamomyces ciferrii (strain ATCC 14091 / BCRC 22168 / CBS 111 / JCM 3599 / NBRC 0793 / NRRL Y-1031 F-60-10) TaxID=1206466 RepID=K0KXD1_WICCF|nr:Pre-rRNA-processing protein [Wickerhamomyces ciferrii]CCH46139.1 Pre-rRNA-processing protein [Wickerhamomyces ciferrii]